MKCQYKSLPLRDLPPLGLARAARQAFEEQRLRRGAVPPQGKPSAFAVGDWVRVKDADAVRATLDADNRHRGLWFTDSQWSYCGGTYQVEHVVRRMIDDHYRFRSLSRTTTLAGATCLGADRSQGCGLSCALLFRDDWLEPSEPELATPQPAALHATVLPVDRIRATLDSSGRLDGVPFQPGMERWAGTRHPAVPVQHRSLARWQRPVGGPWYTLDGLRCLGEPLGGYGCDRQCALLWHASWLRLEP
jgi:hypothetical protein